jgi:hypothetical protein
MTLLTWYSIVVFTLALLDGLRGVERASNPNPRSSVMSPMRFFMNFFNSFQDGKIILPHGKYDLMVPTNAPPKSVWISEAASGPVQVCHGQGNYYGVSTLPDGFVLHADIATESAEINWQTLF